MDVSALAVFTPASKLRKLFALTKDDDVRKYVIARKFENKKGKTVTKAGIHCFICGHKGHYSTMCPSA